MKRTLAIALAAAGLLVSAAPSHAAQAETPRFANCIAGAKAFEHWTKARHISYDATRGCDQIKQVALRRCVGRNYTYNSGWTVADTIDRQYTGCDAVSTTTYAFVAGWTLRSVTATA